MKMLRHYFLSDNLDDLDTFEEQLEAGGVATPQIHVLTLHDEALEHHEHLHRVQSFMKGDVVHSALIGAGVGVCAAAFILWISHLSGWTESAAGWPPFIFLSLIMLGFCTWEGGLFGIQRPNYHFARFEQALHDGKHIFFVDLKRRQEDVLKSLLEKYPGMELAGTENCGFCWIAGFNTKVPRFFKQTFP